MSSILCISELSQKYYLENCALLTNANEQLSLIDECDEFFDLFDFSSLASPKTEHIG